MIKLTTRTLPLTVIILVVLAVFRTPAAGQANLPLPSLYFPMVSRSLASWIGPYGGTFTALAGDPSSSNVFYAGSWGAGVFKTIDGGATWTPINQGLGNLFIQSIAVDPVRPNIVFASTYKYKLYKSIDNGATWLESNNGIQPEAVIYSIAIDRQNPDVIFIGTRGISTNGIHPYNGIIYRSSDGGQSWIPVLSDIGLGNDGKPYQDWAYEVTISPNNSQLVVAALHQNGAWRSTAGGAPGTWIQLGPWSAPYGRSVVIFPGQPNDSRALYGGWTTDGNEGGAYITGEVGIGNPSWLFASGYFKGFDVYRIFINPYDPNSVHLATFYKGIWTSRDQGANWKEAGLAHIPLYSMAARSPYSYLAATFGEGVVSSENSGDSWQGAINGLTGAPVTGIVPDPTDDQNLFVSTIGGGIYHTVNGGTNWIQYTRDLPELYLHDAVMRPGSSQLFTLTDTNGLYVADTAAPGGYWSSSSTGLPQKAADALLTDFQPDQPLAGSLSPEEPALEQRDRAERMPGAVTAAPYKPLLTMVFSPSNPQIGYIGISGGGLYKTSTGGSQWAPAGLDPLSVLAIAVHPLDPNILYAATSQVGVIKSSLDGGANWSDLVMPTADMVYSLALAPDDPGILYAGTSAGIYRFSENSWAPIGLPTSRVTAIGVHPSQPWSILVGTDSGAYRSMDKGMTWDQAPVMLNGIRVQTIRFDLVPDGTVWVYYGTADHGVLRERFN